MALDSCDYGKLVTQMDRNILLLMASILSQLAMHDSSCITGLGQLKLDGDQVKMPPKVSRYMRLFGKRLEMARHDAGYEAAQQFAALIDMEPHTYRKYERGESQPPFEKLIEIAKHLRVTTDYLLTGNREQA